MEKFNVVRDTTLVTKPITTTKKGSCNFCLVEKKAGETMTLYEEKQPGRVTKYTVCHKCHDLVLNFGWEFSMFPGVAYESGCVQKRIKTTVEDLKKELKNGKISK